MSALLYDVAVLHDEDHIRIAYGRQAVCDDKAGTSLHQMIHRFLDRHLCARINRRRRLVKNQDLVVCKNCSGDGEKLLLPL